MITQVVVSFLLIGKSEVLSHHASDASKKELLATTYPAYLMRTVVVGKVEALALRNCHSVRRCNNRIRDCADMLKTIGVRRKPEDFDCGVGTNGSLNWQNLTVAA